MPALLQSTIDIKASASRVWDILCHLERYGEWNPFVTEARGTLRRGQHLDLMIAPPDEPAFRLDGKVLEADAVGRIVVQCDDTTDHTLMLEPTPTGVTFTQTQRRQGEDAEALAASGSRIQLGLDMMNAALKARAER